MDLYSIRDIKAGLYNPPFVSQNTNTAKRDVGVFINTETHTLPSQYPSDYELWKVGHFDEIHGDLITGLTFDDNELNHFVCNLSELKTK